MPNPALEVETQKFLGVLSHALAIFGTASDPVEPSPFAAPRDLEDNLGRGRF